MPPEQRQQNDFQTGMDSPNTKISSGNWSLIVVCKFIAERIITCQCTNENPGNSLTKRDFRLQSGKLAYKTRFSFTKRDSRVTNGTLALHFTIKKSISTLYGKIIKQCFFRENKYFTNIKISIANMERWWYNSERLV